MARLLQRVAGVLQGFLSYIQQRLAELTKFLGRVVHTGDCTAQFIPNIFLQTAPSWWRCPAEGNQGLPEHGWVWRYRLCSSGYPRNDAWQMALRCFAKCSWRAHRLGICREPQEAIWHHCEKLLRCVPNHHQLGSYKPGTFAGHGNRAGCWWLSGQPSFHTNSSSEPSRPEHLWSDPVGPSWTKNFRIDMLLHSIMRSIIRKPKASYGM